MSVPPGPYPFYPYDPSNLPVTDADMQAALTDYALLVSPSFTTPVIGAATGTSLVLSGLLDLQKASTANILQYATNGFLRTDTSQLTLHNAGTGRDDISFSRNGSTMVLSSAFALGFCDNVNASGGSIDVQISRRSAGVVQIGTTAANALGSLACANVTCGPGLVSAPALTLGDAGTGFYKVATNQIGVTVNGVDTFRFSNGNVVYCFQDFVTYGKLQFGTQSNTTPMLKKTGTSLGVRLSDDSADAPLTASNVTASGTVTLGTYTVATLPSAAANTRARAFASDSNLAFNSTNLGSTVTAGGSTLVPVFSNGTNWVIG